MNNSREKFELKISMEYEQPPCLDRDGDGYDDSYVDNAWWGWQAATEQSQKEIAALQAREKELVEALEACKYDCNTGEIIGIARDALATVRGE